MTAQDKAREVANGIKKEIEEEKAEKKEAVEKSLATLKENKNLQRMYSESAQIGAANLAGELPLLKVHAAGRSINQLADGTDPLDGNFFYKPSGEQFEKIKCHVLTISKGFRAPGMEKEEEKFNQILGGVMLDGKPFIMYFTGIKLSNLWEFGKEAGKWTHAKPFPIPMFALTVELSTEKQKTDYGYSWVVKFNIVKTEEGQPEIVVDEGEFTFLKDTVETVEETISSLIARKAREEEVVTPIQSEEAGEAALAGPGSKPFE